MVPTPRAAGDARYVSVHGDDGGSGTADHPWRTLSASLPKLYAGQVLYVHGGVYREVLDKLNLHDGRERQPITVTNVRGEVPVIKGSVSLHRPDHWEISGLNVTWDPSLTPEPRFMVKIIGGRGWSWVNSEFWGSRGTANVFVAGFGSSEPSGWSLTGDCLHGLRTAPPADPAANVMLGRMVDPGGGAISRNVIFNHQGQDNLMIGAAHAAPANVVVSNNTIYGGRFAMVVRGGPHDISVTRNVLGGTSSDVLVRFDLKRSPGTVLSQNYAVAGPSSKGGVARLLRPAAEAAIGGPGNVVTARNPHFADSHSCDGFHTRVAAVSPYGRYGL